MADEGTNPRPDRKRPRTDASSYADDDTDTKKVFTNHPDLYFEDGNVILRCERTLFCVHRSLISKHSEIFRDLFGSETKKPQEFFRGCLFIPLDDDVNDMETLLNTIYDGL